MLEKSRVLAIVNAYAQNAWGDGDTELTKERAEALDRYYGRPYGDEIEGRSQVVSKDLSEAVDWTLPGLIKMFLASGRIVQFDPVGPEDEELSEQETDYVNHVILKENNGWLILHDLFKEALLLKNAYAKHYYEVKDEDTVERYAGLTEEELVYTVKKLEEEGEVEVVEQEERPSEAGPVFDVKFRVTRKVGKECIEAVPVEEIRVSKRLRGPIRDAEYVEHRPPKTRSDLIAMGMSKEFVYSLPPFDSEEDSDEDDSRDQYEDGDLDSVDKSMQRVEYREVYCRIDYDEDGKAELRKIIIAGNRIPDGPEWNEEVDCIPFTSFVCKRMPHRHIGESMNDEVADIARQKTVFWRQMLDNLYVINNSEWLVNERVELEDFLVSRPNGVKRVRDSQPIGDCAVPVAKTPILDKVLPAIDYLDRVKAARTGISQGNTSMDADLLKKTTEGAFMESMARTDAKVEMIARMLAEGVKELALAVHSDLIKYQDKPKMVRLRNKFVPIDTQLWKNRSDLTINVGLGNGTQETERTNMQLLAMALEKVAAFGLVGPQQAFNWFEDTAEILGRRNPQRYVMDPTTPEFQQAMQAKQQPPQPSPDTMVLAQVEQAKIQGKLQEALLKAQADMLKQRDQMMVKVRELIQKGDLEIAKMEVDAFIAGASVDLGEPGIGAELGQTSQPRA